MERRVVVTGLGVISPIGNDVETFWGNVQAGKVGIKNIEDEINMEGLNTKVAAFVQGFEPLDWMSKMEIRRFDLFSQYAIAAGLQAANDAKLDIEEQSNYNPERFGTMIGNGIGGLNSWTSTLYSMYAEGMVKPKPLFIPTVLSNMAAGNVAMKLKAQGPSAATMTACSAGTDAIGIAFRTIKYGDADMMIAGGAEAPMTREGIGGFEALTALSKSEDPNRASIPFDAERGGFVMGEGAGLIILEELEHAKARGAKIYCELIGYGATNDAYHMTSPDPEGNGAKRAMEMAINDAKISVEDVVYINAHGTSTKANDAHETVAIKKVFGEHAYNLAISSTKSMTGHLLGATGGVEGIVAALSVKDGFIPATMNLKVTAEDLDLDYVPNIGRKQAVPIAMSNTFGFGGHNATLVFKAYNE
jgi:beta-ketoacyl-acyl-carrier-protein synthase II